MTLYNHLFPLLLSSLLLCVPLQFIALRIPTAAIYVDTLRECYEAYVIYNFLRYLLNYLESEYDLGEEFRKMDPVRCPLPLCCFPAKKLDMCVSWNHEVIHCRLWLPCLGSIRRLMMHC